MTDSFGDGWNSNILAIQQLDQNNAIVGTFGGAFTTGATSGPISITVMGNLQTNIIVSQLGTKTNEIGFVVKAPNGTIIHQRTSGATFTSTTNFKTFCPVGLCPSINSSYLTITMTDSAGNGWNGGSIAILQNNVVVGTFGNSFLSGFVGDTVYIPVLANLTGTIAADQTGNATS